MTENNNPNSETENYDGGISRRELFRRTASAGKKVATVGVALSVGKFIESDQTPEEGISTPVARFFPIYEMHMPGPAVTEYSKYPPLDSVFIEYVGGLENQEPDNLISGIITARQLVPALGEKEKRELLPRAEALYSKFAKDKTTLAFGDFEALFSPNDSNETKLFKIMFMGTELSSLIEACFGGAISASLIKVAQKEKNDLTRRQFLKIIGAGTAAFSLSPLLGSFAHMAGASIETEDKLIRSLKHVLLRISGIQSDFHPEKVTVFFRNIIWAIKLLTLAEQTPHPTGELPKIGFIAGTAHSGVEDFLILGKDFCYGLLEKLSPDWYLKQLSEANGGPERFASIKQLKFRPDLNDFRFDYLEGSKSPFLESESIVDQKLKTIVGGRLK